MAGASGHHGLTDFAAEGFAELWHILGYTIDAKFAGRMGVGRYLKADLLGTVFSAPVLAMRKKDLPHGAVPARILCIQVNALALGVFFICDERQAQATVVGGVFAEDEVAVDFEVIDSSEATVFLHFAVGHGLVFLGVFVGPPVGDIAAAVELATLVVKAVSKLVADDASDVSVVFSISGIDGVERRLPSNGDARNRASGKQSQGLRSSILAAGWNVGYAVTLDQP
jgi:hypothetical protein